MKKRTVAKTAVAIAVCAAAFVAVKAVPNIYASDADTKFAAPTEPDVVVAYIENTESTEETTVPTEVVEVIETTIPVTTEPTTEETTVPTTEPIVESTEATKPAQKTQTTEPTVAPTVPATTEPEVTEPEVTEPEVTVPATEPEVTVPTTESTTPVVEETVPVHVHNYVATATVAANCSAGGFTTYACECGDMYNGDFTQATAHEYSHQVVSPTTEEEGYTLHVCPACGDSYKDSYTAKVVVVEETAPANCCPEGEHQHVEIVKGRYTYVFCEGYADSVIDGFYIYQPWDHRP